jgi:hypothetical protein
VLGGGGGHGGGVFGRESLTVLEEGTSRLLDEEVLSLAEILFAIGRWTKVRGGWGESSNTGEFVHTN